MDRDRIQLWVSYIATRGTPLTRRGRASLGPQALGFSHLLVGPHPHSRSLGGFAPRSGRRRFPLSLVPFPFLCLTS